jgi:hypothetical protein
MTLTEALFPSVKDPSDKLSWESIKEKFSLFRTE